VVPVLFMLFVFIYDMLCPTRFAYQMMFVSLSSNTPGITCGAGTANPSGAREFTTGFIEVCVARSLVFYVMYCRSLFGLLLFVVYLRFTVLCCIFLITTFVSSHFSYINQIKHLILFLVFNATFNNISAISWRPALVV
jgi:hypothetical protein